VDKTFPNILIMTSLVQNLLKWLSRRKSAQQFSCSSEKQMKEGRERSVSAEQRFLQVSGLAGIAAACLPLMSL
jgi:hypothetical protein